MPGRHVPSSAIAAFIDRARIEQLIAPWVQDPADRAFVTRCMLDEGPAHHRGANFVLLALLGELAQRAGGAQAAPGELVTVPMRLPPHVAPNVEDGVYPLRFPKKVLEAIARDEGQQQAMIDCLTDGPPQHSLANAAMLCLIAALFDRVGAPR